VEAARTYGMNVPKSSHEFVSATMNRIW